MTNIAEVEVGLEPDEVAQALEALTRASEHSKKLSATLARREEEIALLRAEQEAELSAERKARQNAEDSLAEMRKKFLNSQRAAGAERQQVAELKARLEQVKAETGSLIAAARTEKEILHRSGSERHQEAESAKAAQRGLEKRLQDTEAKLAIVEHEKLVAAQRIAELEAELRKVDKELESRVHPLRVEKEELSRQRSEQREAAQKAIAAQRGLEKELQETADKLAASQRETAAAERRIAQLEGKARQRERTEQARVQLLLTEKERLEREREAESAATAEERAARERAEEALAETKSKLLSAYRATGAERKKLSELQDELTKAKVESDAALRAARAETAVLRRHSTEQHDAAQAAEAARRGLEENLQKTREALSVSQSSAAAQQARISELEAELEKADEKLELRTRPLRVERDQLRRQSLELREAAAREAAARRGAESELEENRAKLAAAQRDIAVARQRTSELETQVAQFDKTVELRTRPLRVERDELSRQSAGLHEAARDANAARRGLEKELQETKETLATAQRTSHVAQEQAARLEARVKEVSKRRDDSRTKSKDELERSAFGRKRSTGDMRSQRWKMRGTRLVLLCVNPTQNVIGSRAERKHCRSNWRARVTPPWNTARRRRCSREGCEKPGMTWMKHIASFAMSRLYTGKRESSFMSLRKPSESWSRPWFRNARRADRRSLPSPTNASVMNEHSPWRGLVDDEARSL